MELGEQSLRSLSPAKTYHIPPDVNAGTALFTPQHWYSKIVIPSPPIYLSHISVAIIFGTLSLIFGILSHGVVEDLGPFWDLFPEFVVAVISLCVAHLIQSHILPGFWRRRAKQMVNEGFFDSSTRPNGRRRLVLEIGCNEGKTSALFARAIIDRQRDIANLKAPHASMPMFIGYDWWTKWSRIPNSPACFLSTLVDTGIPREYIIANRMDRTDKESRSSLPYPSGSISLVICNFGISELRLVHEEGTALFHELVRILEPEGRLLLVEGQKVGKCTFWEGATGTYQRLLVEDLGWPLANVVKQKEGVVRYLSAVKPTFGTSEKV